MYTLLREAPAVEWCGSPERLTKIHSRYPSGRRNVSLPSKTADGSAAREGSDLNWVNADADTAATIAYAANT
jgi:hypothetical protein